MLPAYQLPGVGLRLLTGEVRHNIRGTRGGAGHDGSGGCGGRVLQVTDRLLLPQSAGQLLQRSKENISVKKLNILSLEKNAYHTNILWFNVLGDYLYEF